MFEFDLNILLLYQKNEMKRKNIIVLILLIMPTLLFARHFKVMQVMNGLSDNTVKCITQDKNGFIWLGTFNGLCRFDGNEFTIFKHNPKDSLSIVGNHVSAMQAMPDGLWIGTDKGLCFFSFDKSCFYPGFELTSSKERLKMTKPVTNITADGEKLFVLDASGNFFSGDNKESIFELCDFKTKNQWYSTIVYKDGLLLASSSDGVYLLNPNKGKVISKLNYAMRSGGSNSVFYSKNTNIIYIGYGLGYASDAFVLDARLQFERIEEAVPHSLKAMVDFKGKTVFGTDGNGLVFKEKEDREMTTLDNSNISSDAVYSLFVDKDSSLWVGTYRGGVNIYSDHYNDFKSLTMGNGRLTHKMVTAVLVLNDQLYIGLDGGGLNVHDLTTGKTASYTQNNSNIAGNNILSLSNDKKYVWLGIWGKGLCRYSPKDRSFKTFKIPVINNKENPNHIWEIKDTDDGRIWIIGPELYIFDKENEKFTMIHSFDNMSLSALAPDDENVWVCSKSEGLFKINKDNYQIKAHYFKDSSAAPIGNSPIQYLYVDSKHQVWFSSEYSGLSKLNEKTGSVTSYGVDNGLTNTNVAGIIEERGYLWVSTQNGLFRFDPATETFARFGKEDNIPSVQFNNNACFRQNDRLFFGTTDGLVYFNPSNIGHEAHSNPVYFTGFELINNNREIRNLYSDNPKEICLSHNQNFFTIHFSVPELLSSEKIIFSCYMENFEEGWRDISNDWQISYTNVPPGEYVFKIRSSDGEGRWSENISSLRIIIAQPWWKTGWALCLWTLLLLGLLLFILWFYRRDLKIKHVVQLKEMEKNTAKSISEAKLNFFTNITHELRTPIFLITALIEELSSSGKKPKSVSTSSLTAIQRNAMRLNKLVSRIIDFRKMESGKLELEKQSLNVVSFCKNLAEDYEALCQQKDIIFYFHPSRTSIRLDFDAEKLESILSNLVSNAFKYTQEGGKIVLSIDDDDTSVLFSVEDNGIGIKKEYHEMIFDRFYQIDPAKGTTGDGIGLTFVKNLVELHGGTVRIESESGQGSKFIFDIPKTEMKTDAEETSVIVDAEIKPAVNEVMNSIQSPTTAHSILIIDDEKETVEVLERFLVEDFKIMKASNGVDGLTLTKEMLPDIIICDIMMPKMDGMEFLSLVKGDKKLAHIPVIMFTAKTSEEDKMVAFDGGADAYLTKPISLKYLRKRIDHLFAQLDSHDEVKLISNTEKKVSKEGQRFLLQCREIIDANLTNSDFSIIIFAEKLGMSHSALYKKIRMITGLSAFDFISEYRVFKAVQYLNEGETNVNSVMAKCGFKDGRSFRDAFKKKMQVTPKQYVNSKKTL